MFALSEVRVTIGRAEILRGVSLAIAPGTSAALVGRNGAGKTTLMRAVMGLVALHAGRVELDGLRLDQLPSHRRAALGIGYMPEDRRLVPQWTVSDNLLFPLWAIGEHSFGDRLEHVLTLLPELRAWSSRKALQLSGGQQKIVALGRALMCGTRLLLLDEPFEGVAPALAVRLRQVIDGLKGQSDLAVLLAASNYSQAADLVDRLYTIERGAVAESSDFAAASALEKPSHL
jgi:branched-chain amino acid transport system ATP-binding protein